MAIPPLKALVIRCGACHGSGRHRHISCHECKGRGYFIGKRSRSMLEITPAEEYQVSRKRHQSST